MLHTKAQLTVLSQHTWRCNVTCKERKTLKDPEQQRDIYTDGDVTIQTVLQTPSNIKYIKAISNHANYGMFYNEKILVM